MQAAINGACAGGGMGQAMNCDIRFAASDATFSTAFARRGLIAEWGISWALPRVVGQGAAMDLLLSARKFKGDEAKEIGIVQKVFPKETLVEETVAYARDMADNVPAASLAVIKDQVLRHPYMAALDALEQTNKVMSKSTQLPNFVVSRQPAASAHPNVAAPCRLTCHLTARLAWAVNAGGRR